MNHLSVQKNPRAKSTLPSDTLPNPKNNGHCMTIATRSGRLLDNVNVVTKRVVNEKLNDGVNTSSPIPIVVDDDFVNGENVCLEE